MFPTFKYTKHMKALHTVRRQIDTNQHKNGHDSANVTRQQHTIIQTKKDGTCHGMTRRMFMFYMGEELKLVERFSIVF